jgi:serine phosphatase RsbU (regulator of sigma subunit)
LGVVFFTGITLSYFANKEAQTTIKTQILSELTGVNQSFMNNLDRFMHQRVTDVKGFAKDPVIRYSSDKEEIKARLRQLEVTHQIYDAFSFFTIAELQKPDSSVRLTASETRLYDRYRIRALENTDKDYVIDFSADQKKIIHFISFVKDDSSKVTGVIIARMLIERMYEIFSMNSDNNYLYDSFKIDLINSERLLIYSNYNEEGILSEKYKDLGTLEVIEKQDTSVYETVDKLYFITKDKGYMNYIGEGWTFISSISKEKAFAPVKRLSSKLVYISMIITIVSGIIAYIFAKRLSNPINQLTKSADKIASGNFDTQLNVTNHDEIGYLAKQFQFMAVSLKKKIIEIQEQKRKIESQNKEINHAFSEIETKNKQILASINYAKKIQQSMLPDKTQLFQYFADAFVLYLPKDIVSGDFFWFDTVHDKLTKKKQFVIAAADCTGHGVPGAILSILGSNLLTNILLYGGYTQPKEVLARLNKNIIAALRQEESVFDNSQDGMEIALCSFDMETNEILFAGGGRPLWIIREGNLIILDGDRVTVGGVSRLAKKKGASEEFNITEHTFQIKRGDKIYLFSDGFKDQLGKDKKRFSERRFKELITDIAYLPMSEQQGLLQKILIEYSGDEKQTDDILIIGIEI